jgi:hypothetical protein
MTKQEGRPFNEDELINQIGRMNVFAISGGRVGVIVNNEGETVEVELPVSNGYSVSIALGWNDTWTVSRQFVRKGVVSDKGTVRRMSTAKRSARVAYKASCFRNVQFGEKESA